MNNPYLIQRLIRKSVEGSVRDKIFSEVFGLGYMGSAEFEFGAFAKYLRSMDEALRLDHLDTGHCTVEGRKVFFIYDVRKHDLNEAIEAIQGVAKGKFRLKEMANFPPDDKNSWCRADAWADIQNNMFWSYENITIGMGYMIRNSVKYMDEKAKES